MPELPEVEVIKEGLRRKLRKRVIKGINIIFKGSIKNISPLLFEKKIRGRRFEEISRRGKFLIFTLDDGSFLVIHLKMTGQLVYSSPRETMDKHTCLVFALDNNFQLRFMDMRRFGIVCLVKELAEISLLAEMGPEPLENNFTSFALAEILQGQKRKIKVVLLDQRMIAGLGNIYAMEALYQAGVNPERRANRLTGAEIEALYGAIKDILKKAISSGGTSIDTYRNAEGKKGKFQYRLQVYQREGEPCYRCGAIISRVKLSGRSTYFCPQCQK